MDNYSVKRESNHCGDGWNHWYETDSYETAKYKMICDVILELRNNIKLSKTPKLEFIDLNSIDKKYEIYNINDFISLKNKLKRGTTHYLTKNNKVTNITIYKTKRFSGFGLEYSTNRVIHIYS